MAMTTDSDDEGTVTPEVDVSVVVFNTWEDALTCVRSVVRTSYPGLKTIAICDNGRENRILPADLISKVQVITPVRNIGYGAGNNLNSELGTAEWILLANPDCVFPARAFLDFSRALGALEPETVAVAPRLQSPIGETETSLRTLPSVLSELSRLFFLEGRFGTTSVPKSTYQKISYVEQPPGACMWIRRSVYELVGGFDSVNFPLYFDDVDLCRRLLAHGKIAYVPTVSVVHGREGTARKYRAKATFWIEYGRRSYARKHLQGVRQIVAVGCGILSCLSRAAAFSLAGRFKDDYRERGKGYRLALVSFWRGDREYWVNRML